MPLALAAQQVGETGVMASVWWLVWWPMFVAHVMGWRDGLAWVPVWVVKSDQVTFLGGPFFVNISYVFPYGQLWGRF